MNIEIKNVENLEIEGVQSSDYPDFCDAYWVSGWHTIEKRELTEDELNQLGYDYPEALSDMAYQSLI